MSDKENFPIIPLNQFQDTTRNYVKDILINKILNIEPTVFIPDGESIDPSNFVFIKDSYYLKNELVASNNFQIWITIFIKRPWEKEWLEATWTPHFSDYEEMKSLHLKLEWAKELASIPEKHKEEYSQLN